MRICVLIAGALFSGYLALAIYAWFFSDHLIHHPGMASTRALKEGVKLMQGKPGALSALYLPQPGAKFTIWVFHGNAEGLGDSEPFLRELQQRGFNVFTCDYPGYGLSEGSPSETAIYEATRVGLRYLQVQHGVTPGRIIAYGRSLGGGPAVELAAHERIAGLILQSTFTSAFRVVTHWPILPFDQFENLRKLPQVTCPVLVMHGREDRVVPFRHGEQLYAAAREPKQKLWVPAAGHNDFLHWAGEDFWGAIAKFERSLNEIGRTEGTG